MRSIKTRFVNFTFGTVKNAALELPAEDYSANDAACLIRKSYLAYIFNPARACIFSDETATSSIGQANFFEGALGGYKTRLDVEFFALVESCAHNWIALACDVVRHRAEKQGRTMTNQEVYAQAAKNEALDETSRKLLSELSKVPSV